MTLPLNYYSKKGILVLLLVFICFDSYSQISIKGLVLDSQKKTPISDVNILIKDSSLGTISNSDGEFVIVIPNKYKGKEILFSHLGYNVRELSINQFIKNNTILLEPNSTELNEVVITAYKKPLTANEIIHSAFNRYNDNFPNKPFISKGFLRHSERNKKEYKWLIESYITMYDNAKYKEDVSVKISIDEQRKSYDARKVDSLNLYLNYLISEKKKGYNVFKRRKRKKIKDTVSKSELIKGIVFNDIQTNGLNKLFNGHKNIIIDKNNFNNGNQNIIRNYNNKEAIFDKNILKKHKFSLDTILVEGERRVFKIKITPNQKMINLNKVLKKDYIPIGWFYIYRDNFAIKEIEYTLIASSKDAKLRNSLLFDSPIHYKINLKYIEYNNKMYLKYFSCNIPKTLGSLNLDKNNKDYYYTKQEVLFSEIINNKKEVNEILINKNWDNNNLFLPRKYNSTFWENNTILLESKEQKKLISDLEKKATLKNQFKKN